MKQRIRTNIGAEKEKKMQEKSVWKTAMNTAITKRNQVRKKE